MKKLFYPPTLQLYNCNKNDWIQQYYNRVCLEKKDGFKIGFIIYKYEKCTKWGEGIEKMMFFPITIQR